MYDYNNHIEKDSQNQSVFNNNYFRYSNRKYEMF